MHTVTPIADRPATSSGVGVDVGVSESTSGSSSALERELLDVHEAASLPRLVRDLLPPAGSNAAEQSDSDSASDFECEPEASPLLADRSEADDEEDYTVEEENEEALSSVQVGVQLDSDSESEDRGLKLDTCARSAGTFALRIPGANSPPAVSLTLRTRSQSCGSDSASASDRESPAD